MTNSHLRIFQNFIRSTLIVWSTVITERSLWPVHIILGGISHIYEHTAPVGHIFVELNITIQFKLFGPILQGLQSFFVGFIPAATDKL